MKKTSEESRDNGSKWQWSENKLICEPRTALEAEFELSIEDRRMGRKASENLNLPFCCRFANIIY